MATICIEKFLHEVSVSARPDQPPTGVFHKLNRNSLNSGNLINHWNMNWAQFKDPVTHMCLAGTVVASWSLTQEVAGQQVRAHLLKWQIFCHWIQQIQWKHLGKTQLNCQTCSRNLTNFLVSRLLPSTRCSLLSQSSVVKEVSLENTQFRL